MASRNSSNVSSSRSATSLRQFDVVFGVHQIRPQSDCRQKPSPQKESVVVSGVVGCPPEMSQIVSGIDARAVSPTRLSMVLTRIIFVGNYRNVLTIPGGAGTSSRNFFIPHQATIAGPMARIVSFVILSVTFLTPKCSVLNYLTSQLSRLLPSFVFPESILLQAQLSTPFHRSLLLKFSKS